MCSVYVKEDICIGCHLCEVYCQLRHSQSKELVKAFRRELPRPLPRVRVEERGVVSFSVRCQQCTETPCAYACITGALTYNHRKGVVEVDEARCAGCWTCLLVCPLGAIRQDTMRGKILKCDLCQGDEVPVCVANCPNEALSLSRDDEAISVHS